ncbi:hypothetical protein GJ744_004943 [Endocarpon pusillum]|uniref:Uncharacterized protein n=1 Tax=Endocarpon pusillum TaxID=364733 RepID=A0A8H7A5A1_9EURO|nr:hypothetical protein GJ744_004943 [Endocarpon pusillum]
MVPKTLDECAQVASHVFGLRSFWGGLRSSRGFVQLVAVHDFTVRPLHSANGTQEAMLASRSSLKTTISDHQGKLGDMERLRKSWVVEALKTAHRGQHSHMRHLL